MLLHEIMPRCSIAAGTTIDQELTILDLTGASLKILSKKVYHFI